MKAFDRNKNLERKRMEKKITTTASTETDSNTKEVQKEQHPEILKVCLSSDDSDCESDDVSDLDCDDYNSESAMVQKDKEDGRIEAEMVAKNWRKFAIKHGFTAISFVKYSVRWIQTSYLRMVHLILLMICCN